MNQHRIVWTTVDTQSKHSEEEARKVYETLVSALKLGECSNGMETTVELKKWDSERKGWITTKVYSKPPEIEKKPLGKL